MKVTLVREDRPATTDILVSQVRLYLEDGLVLVLEPDPNSEDLHAYLTGQGDGERRLVIRPLAAAELRIGVES